MATIPTENDVSVQALPEHTIVRVFQTNAANDKQTELYDEDLLDSEDDGELIESELSAAGASDYSATTNAAVSCADGSNAANPQQSQQKLYNARNWANHIDCRPTFNNYFPSSYLQQQLLKRYDPVVDRLSRHEVVEHFSLSDKVGPIPAHALPHDAAELCVCANKVRSFVNKIKHAVKCVTWTPNAERIIVCNQAGEITLWEGKGFQFDSIVQAHDHSIETMRWAHNESLLLTGDTSGLVKLWQPNINCVYAAAMHGARVTSIAWAPTDRLFATSSDDSAQQLAVWDLFSMRKVRQLPTGKRRGIRCLDWNSRNSVLIAASREIENGLCLFDARTGEAESYVNGLNAAMLTLEWHPDRENYWITGGKDRCVRLWDLRMLDATRGVVANVRCDSDITKLRWHPAHAEIFLSGEGDGSISYWHTRFLLGNNNNSASSSKSATTMQLPATRADVLPPSSGAIFKLTTVHDAYVRDIAIHPLGHLIVTAGCNGICSVWSRLALRSSSERGDAAAVGGGGQKNHQQQGQRTRRRDENQSSSVTAQPRNAPHATPAASGKRSIANVLTNDAADSNSEPSAKKQCEQSFQFRNNLHPAVLGQTPAQRQLAVIQRLQPVSPRQQQSPMPIPSINFQQSPHVNFPRIPYLPPTTSSHPFHFRSRWPMPPGGPRGPPWPPLPH